MIHPFVREVACFLVPEHGVLSITSNNTSHAVEFIWQDIWPLLRGLKYSHVCMIHSHPPEIPRISSIDENMVYGWVQALGKPIFYIIVTESEVVTYLCQRAEGSTNKITREIVDVKFGEDVDQVLDIIWELSQQKGGTSYPMTVKGFNDICYKGLSITVVDQEEEVST